MIRVNLLPVREERRRANVQQQVLLVALALVVSVAGLGIYHWTLRSRIDQLQGNIVQLEAQLRQYTEQLAQVEEFRKQKADIETKLGVIEGLERARSGPVHMLDELATRAPDRLWLTQLEAGTSGVQLEGMSLDNERLARFITSMESSEYFTGVELVETEFEDVRGLKLAHFKLNASLTHPGAEDEADAAAAAGGAAAAPTGTGR